MFLTMPAAGSIYRTTWVGCTNDVVHANQEDLQCSGVANNGKGRLQVTLPRNGSRVAVNLS